MNNPQQGMPAFILSNRRSQPAATLSSTLAAESIGRCIIKFDYCLPPEPPRNSNSRSRRKK